MHASNVFFGILLLVLFGVMQVPSFHSGYWIFSFDIPNPLYVIFASTPLYTIPFINYGITFATIILVIAIIMLISGFIPSPKKPTK